MDEEAYGGVGLLAMLPKLPSVTWVPPLRSYLTEDRDAGNAELMARYTCAETAGGQWRATLPWLICTNSRNSRSRDS
jgi:hypothetical protein